MDINNLGLEQQKIITDVQMQEHRIKQLEAQLGAIDKQINEMRGITESLESIDKTDEKNSEVLLPIGRGIFVRNKLTSKNVILNIGSGVVIDKNAKDTIKLVNEQIKKLSMMSQEYQEEIISMSRKIESTISKLQQ